MAQLMRRFFSACIFTLITTLLLAAPAQAGEIGPGCIWNGHQLWGKVQFVTSFPDVRVEINNAFPDLRVQRVTAFPDSCGKWEVNQHWGLRVQIVQSFGDFRISFVNAFPGVR